MDMAAAGCQTWAPGNARRNSAVRVLVGIVRSDMACNVDSNLARGALCGCREPIRACVEMPW